MQSVGAQIDFFAQAGVDGVYTHGTAAEFHGQSEAMFWNFAEIVAERSTVHQLPYQIGATHPFAHETIERIRYARSLAPAAIQVILPDWVPVDVEGAKRFLTGCAEAADGIGLVLYNPPHAKKHFDAKGLVDICSGNSSLVGIKCAGGNDDWYKDMAPLLQELSVFIPGHCMVSGMSKGASGSYSNVACLNPIATVAWRELAKTDLAAALELEARIQQFMDEAIKPFLDEGYPGYACDKFMAHVGGWTDIDPSLLWPYKGIPQENANMVCELGQRIIPEFFPLQTS